MLVKTSLVLLLAWILGMLGVYDIGDYVHGFLLVGLMLLPIAFMRARDAARHADGDPPRP
jgi:hypothetical protein